MLRSFEIFGGGWHAKCLRAAIYGDSELKVGKALRGRRDGVVLATKFGFVQDRIGAAERIDGIGFVAYSPPREVLAHEARRLLLNR